MKNLRINTKEIEKIRQKTNFLIETVYIINQLCDLLKSDVDEVYKKFEKNDIEIIEDYNGLYFKKFSTFLPKEVEIMIEKLKKEYVLFHSSKDNVSIIKLIFSFLLFTTEMNNEEIVAKVRVLIKYKDSLSKVKYDEAYETEENNNNVL